MSSLPPSALSLRQRLFPSARRAALWQALDQVTANTVSQWRDHVQELSSRGYYFEKGSVPDRLGQLLQRAAESVGAMNYPSSLQMRRWKGEVQSLANAIAEKHLDEEFCFACIQAQPSEKGAGLLAHCLLQEGIRFGNIEMARAALRCPDLLLGMEYASNSIPLHNLVRHIGNYTNRAEWEVVLDRLLERTPQKPALFPGAAHVSPLIIAAINAPLPIIKKVLDAGYSPSESSAQGTALHAAVELRLPERPVVELLVQAGAPLEARAPRTGLTPLLLAIDRRRPEQAIALLQLGADPAATDDEQRSALHYLVSGWKLEEAFPLLRLFPQELWTQPDIDGVTPSDLIFAPPSPPQPKRIAELEKWRAYRQHQLLDNALVEACGPASAASSPAAPTPARRRM